MSGIRQLARQRGGADHGQEQRRAGGEHETGLLPGLLRLFLPEFRLAAGFDQLDGPVHALGQADLVDQRRVLAADPLEVGDTARRQLAEQVALDDLVLLDELAIHGTARDRRQRGTTAFMRTAPSEA